MEIKILGSGCARCRSLEQATKEAITELGLNATVEKVEDIQKIMEYGVMRTPGLIVDGKIVSTGQVPSVKELKTMLSSLQ